MSRTLRDRTGHRTLDTGRRTPDTGQTRGRPVPGRGRGGPGGEWPDWWVVGQRRRRPRPSWATVATWVPSARNTQAKARPRALAVPWPERSNSSHSSARTGRWNHTAWSRLAAIICSQLVPIGSARSATPRRSSSERYASAHAWISGSSPSVWGTRIHDPVSYTHLTLP